MARAIATSGVPVWTGIGHTGDQSVADEVANRAFITPTECGQELAGLAIEYWRRVEDAGDALAGMAHDQVLAADRLLASRQRAVAVGARSQLDRHGDGLGHRARTLRGVSGASSTPTGSGLSPGEKRYLVGDQTCAAGGGRQPRRPVHRLAALPGRRLLAEDQRLDQWRRLLGAYDYQRQLERGYSVTRDALGTGGPIGARRGRGALLRTRVSDGELVSAVEETSTVDPVHRQSTATTHPMKGHSDGNDKRGQAQQHRTRR